MSVAIGVRYGSSSIASAMAVKRLLWRKVNSVIKVYFNKITRPDNLNMIELTDSGLLNYTDVRFDEFNQFVVVDSQPDHHENFSRFSYDAIIDHHAENLQQESNSILHDGLQIGFPDGEEEFEFAHFQPPFTVRYATPRR